MDPGEWIDGDWLPYTDFDELGVTGEVMARVEGIFASPVITEGPGRVVLSTIEHLGEDLYELTLHSADGTMDALGVTAPHRFYSESRGWVAAAELEEGEVLRGHDGPLTVTQIGRIEGTRPVYNFSVEADHVYYAGSVEALTHNAYTARKFFMDAFPHLKQAEDVIRAATGKHVMEVHHRIPQTFRTLFGNEVIDALDNLVGINKSAHYQISTQWQKFAKSVRTRH